MNILKKIFWVIIALMVLFLAIGFFKPSVHYSSETIVEKPIKEAWAVFMDNSKNDQWLTGLQNYTLVSGEENKVGSTYKFQFNEDGNIVDMKETANRIIPNQLYDMTLASPGMMSTDMVITFEEKDETTTIIRSKAETKGEGMMMRSIFALMSMRDGFAKSDRVIYDKLKKVIEENTTDYFESEVPALEAPQYKVD